MLYARLKLEIDISRARVRQVLNTCRCLLGYHRSLAFTIFPENDKDVKHLFLCYSVHIDGALDGGGGPNVACRIYEMAMSTVTILLISMSI